MKFFEMLLLFALFMLFLYIGVRIGKNSKRGNIDESELVFILAAISYLAADIPQARRRARNISRRIAEPFGKQDSVMEVFDGFIAKVDMDVEERRS